MPIFKRMRKIVSSDLFPCPGYFEGLVGKVGGSKEWPNGSSQPQPPPPGYTVALLHKACGLSYVAGAPRYKQRGGVFQLQKEGRETNFVPVLAGEQVAAGEGCPCCYTWRR